MGSRAVVADASADRRTLSGYASGSYMQVRRGPGWDVAAVPLRFTCSCRQWAGLMASAEPAPALHICLTLQPRRVHPHCTTLPTRVQVCGEGDGLEGDAVVPLCSALLAGAEHVVLDGVLHSMSRIRTFDEPSDDEW